VALGDHANDDEGQGMLWWPLAVDAQSTLEAVAVADVRDWGYLPPLVGCWVPDEEELRRTRPWRASSATQSQISSTNRALEGLQRKPICGGALWPALHCTQLNFHSIKKKKTFICMCNETVKIYHRKKMAG
jgi:hypothetical protein